MSAAQTKNNFCSSRLEPFIPFTTFVIKGTSSTASILGLEIKATLEASWFFKQLGLPSQA
jgi:hypothetical protein